MDKCCPKCGTEVSANAIVGPEGRKSIDVLIVILANLLDLQLHFKQAHWNVKGPFFTQLHELFDKAHETCEGFADQVAERIIQLGGLTTVERTSDLPSLGATTDGIQLVKLLAGQVEHIDGITIQGTKDLLTNDPVSADILTEIARDIDSLHWMLFAHLTTN